MVQAVRSTYLGMYVEKNGTYYPPHWSEFCAVPPGGNVIQVLQSRVLKKKKRQTNRPGDLSLLECQRKEVGCVQAHGIKNSVASQQERTEPPSLFPL